MKAQFHNPIGDQEFWKAYASLWAQSTSRSPFQSPQFIQYLIQHNPTAAYNFSMYDRDELIGSVWFEKNDHVLHFLSDRKTDHNSFCIDRNTTESQRVEFFRKMVSNGVDKGYKFQLNYLPEWASFQGSLHSVVEQTGVFCLNIPYSNCPMLKCENPQELKTKLQSSKNTRYKSKRLAREKSAEFEILDNDDSIESWVAQFAQSHIERWSQTNTPSSLVRLENRRFLAGCLHAWHRDGILVRFALKLPDGTRIAHCIGLIHNTHLIHHSHTYDSKYSKYSPGKVLLRFMADWMFENGIDTLDFGDGNESFKYDYANIEMGLNRLYITHKKDLTFRLKAHFIKTVKRNSNIYNIYRDRIKPNLRVLRISS